MNTKLNSLLEEVQNIQIHQKDVDEIKGESFNVFSILKMETRERSTHSAFIGELLDPDGTHLKGSLFLELFLNLIDEQSIDTDSAKVILEHPLGKRDDDRKCGGVVDIYIRDKLGNSLIIENKIYASDQNSQIKRYCNHNPGQNKVYYLSLKGNEPDDCSMGSLVPGKYFQIISYDKEIQRWLKSCQKEAADSPILRETIKQYLILTKKLTSTMDTYHEKKLTSIMLKYYEASKYISSNFQRVCQEIAEQIRLDLGAGLREKLPGYTIETEQARDAHAKWSKIWIDIPGVDNKEVRFGVENFGLNGHFDGNMFFGVFFANNEPRYYAHFRKGDVKGPWANPIQIKTKEGPIHLGDLNLISAIHADRAGYRKKFLEQLIDKIKDLILKEAPHIRNFMTENYAHTS